MKKGISLVALVITIIVLIILAGTIVLTALDVNIFDKAEQARDERNKQEVYSAVQREVLNVQSSRVGLAVSAEFATELKTRLLNKHSGSNATATYNEGTDSIAITFDLGNKTYNLTLDNKYRLTMQGTSSPSDDDVEQFLIDLGITVEKYNNETTGEYNLIYIQEEMEAKYPEAEYIYFTAYTENLIPIFTDKSSDDFILDPEKRGSTDLWNCEIKYKGVKKYIDSEGIKDSIANTLDYIYEDEAREMFDFELDEREVIITAYKLKSDTLDLPSTIIMNDGVPVWIAKIGDNAFEVPIKVDMVEDVLQTTYDVYNSMSVTDLVLGAEDITDVSKSQAYKEGMTKEEYVDAIIALQGGEVTYENGRIYGYMNHNDQFIKQRTSFTQVDLNNGIITDIGSKAFYNNTALTSISINFNETVINSDAFSGCTALTIIEFNSTMDRIKQMSGYSSKWGATNAIIYCTDGTIE